MAMVQEFHEKNGYWNMKKINHKVISLMLITHKQNRSSEDYLNFLATCVHAGVTSIQLREKNLSYDALYAFGKDLQSILTPLSIPLIINDNLQLAYDLDAAGVHLGQSDGDVFKAREQLGDEKIIGLTVNSMEQLKIANQLPVDYVGIGAIFPTQSKKDVSKIWGCDELALAISYSKHPVVAIGGINEHNVLEIMSTGTDGIAMISAIHEASNPIQYVKNLRSIIDKVYDDRIN